MLVQEERRLFANGDERAEALDVIEVISIAEMTDTIYGRKLFCSLWIGVTVLFAWGVERAGAV